MALSTVAEQYGHLLVHNHPDEYKYNDHYEHKAKKNLISQRIQTVNPSRHASALLSNRTSLFTKAREYGSAKKPPCLQYAWAERLYCLFLQPEDSSASCGRWEASKLNTPTKALAL
ncbi:hypothetical protein D1872_261830 [compost metagenome]